MSSFLSQRIFYTLSPFSAVFKDQLRVKKPSCGILRSCVWHWTYPTIFSVDPLNCSGIVNVSLVFGIAVEHSTFLQIKKGNIQCNVVFWGFLIWICFGLGFLQFFKDLMHSVWGFARFAIYEQTWNGPPSTLPLQYSFGSKGTATGINLFLFVFCFFLLLPTSSMLCHIWRLGSHSPSNGEKIACLEGCWVGLFFKTTVFPHFLNFKCISDFIFLFSHFLLSQTTFFPLFFLRW